VNDRESSNLLYLQVDMSVPNRSLQVDFETCDVQQWLDIEVIVR
jgi:hypothetical protein